MALEKAILNARNLVEHRKKRKAHELNIANAERTLKMLEKMASESQNANTTEQKVAPESRSQAKCD